MLLVQRQVLLVDRSLVDRVRTGVVDYFAGKIGNRVFVNRCSIIGVSTERFKRFKYTRNMDNLHK